jgi:hypothetical protein
MLVAPSESVNLPVLGNFPDGMANPEFCHSGTARHSL